MNDNNNYAKELFVRVYIERINQKFTHETAFKEARYAANVFIDQFSNLEHSFDVTIKSLIEIIDWFDSNSDVLPNDEIWKPYLEFRKKESIF